MANDIYIFRPIYEDELYFYLETDGMEFPIEKDICRDIIKPNILRTEEEIPDIIEKVISHMIRITKFSSRLFYEQVSSSIQIFISS